MHRTVIVYLFLSLLFTMLPRLDRDERGAATRHVATATELIDALRSVRAGDTIVLADGTYRGEFVARTNGTATAPITVRGSRRAILDGGSIKGGYVFHLQADFWVLQGFTITNGQKGVMADGANHNRLDRLRVFGIGDEAIHLRAASSDNVVTGCEIADTGRRKPGFGEGVYIGSARSNWKEHSGGKPDRSDRNRVIGCRFGPNVRAEAIDIKEGTTGGEIRGNVFDGTGMAGKNSADSWVDVKGNGYLVADNRCTIALKDGFQTHRILDGWGRDNRFRNNVADVRAEGYGISIHKLGDDALGNIVYADNRVTNAGRGVANVALTTNDQRSTTNDQRRTTNDERRMTNDQ